VESRHRLRNAAFLYAGRYPFFQTGAIEHANFYLTEYSQTYPGEGLAQSKLWKPERSASRLPRTLLRIRYSASRDFSHLALSASSLTPTRLMSASSITHVSSVLLNGMTS